MRNFQGQEYRYPLINSAEHPVDTRAPTLDPILV
jgi:hypothetical protein